MGGSSKRSNGPVLSLRRSNSGSNALGSSSPSDNTSSFYTNFYSSPPPPPNMYSFASSTSATFCSSPASNGFFNHRPSSPTRVNLHGFAPLSQSSSVRFSIGRSASPSRSMAVSPKKQSGNPFTNPPKRTCMCSPTTHQGSFRCSLHKNAANGGGGGQAVKYLPNRLHARRSAMANSLVRIGTVEGDWTRRALTQLIRPSSHQQRRRNDFQSRPSRLSVMSKADDDL